ncbi:MAG: hypothetical protein Ct9H300mP25_07300 [Acidobacteriota bacterium]|nr:MAG: hypothetical protein Ct9H300mP25_07300 [Acidobacteriota bacterium]
MYHRYSGFLGWLIRFLLAVLVIRMVWKFGRVLSKVCGAVATIDGGQVALVKDPVCGTYIRRVDALSARAGEETHYFCSEGCSGHL